MDSIGLEVVKMPPGSGVLVHPTAVTLLNSRVSSWNLSWYRRRAGVWRIWWLREDSMEASGVSEIKSESNRPYLLANVFCYTYLDERRTTKNTHTFSGRHSMWYMSIGSELINRWLVARISSVIVSLWMTDECLLWYQSGVSCCPGW